MASKAAHAAIARRNAQKSRKLPMRPLPPRQRVPEMPKMKLTPGGAAYVPPPAYDEDDELEQERQRRARAVGRLPVQRSAS